MRVYELAQQLGRTEEQVLDALDAIGFTARDSQAVVPQSVIERLTTRRRIGSATSATNSNSSALDTAPAEWTLMKGADEGHDAVIVRYSVAESQRILSNLVTSELLSGRVLSGGNISATIVDHLAKAMPFVLTGMQTGQVFKVIGTPALVQGLKAGSMALMSTAGGSLGTVVTSSSGKIAGQLRFAQASLAPVMAPLLAMQVLHALVGTTQLNRINARLDTMQRSLERFSLRQEAEMLGKANHAVRVLEDILQERKNTGTFSSDMLTRLAHAEETIGSIIERNKILVDELKHRIHHLTRQRGKDAVAQVNSFITEEQAQAAHDMRLLIAGMMADYRITEARIYYALEYAPADVERRLENARAKSMEYRGIMHSMPAFGELQQHARDCIEEMSWWERNVTARGIVKDATRLASVQLPDEGVRDQGSSAKTTQGYVFWKDETGQVHVKLLDN